MSSGRLAFATQGNEFSWHAEAARIAAGTSDIDIIDHDEFRHVLTACIDWYPGLGVMAIDTAKGTVTKSAKALFGRRVSALPYVVKRGDLKIGLSLISAVDQTLEELDRQGVICLLQDEARLQIDAFKRQYLPHLGYESRTESTHAVAEVLAMNNPDVVAVGPSYSAHRVGGFVIGPAQITPEGSVSSFYFLQRTLHEKILPRDPKQDTRVTPIALSHPEGPYEFEKCLDAADKVGVRPVRFIPYRSGKPTKHNPDIKKNGGIIEIEHDYDDPKATKFCSKVNTLTAEDGVDGPFDAKKLGTYDWYPVTPLDLGDLLKRVTDTVPANND